MPLETWTFLRAGLDRVRPGAVFVSDGSRLGHQEKAFDADAALDFCRGKCGCQGLWTIENFIAESIADIRAQVGDRKVVLGLSGGVDSR